ncbi:unnamed protein product, partial [Symbiodinium pilosum]
VSQAAEFPSSREPTVGSRLAQRTVAQEALGTSPSEDAALKDLVQATLRFVYARAADVASRHAALATSSPVVSNSPWARTEE